MSTFKRTDLHYSDYSWKTTGGDQAKIKGFPDNVLLNRREGYEVVYFIDRFVESEIVWSDLTLTEKKECGIKLEKLIHDYLPPDLRSNEHVHEWIVANWSLNLV